MTERRPLRAALVGYGRMGQEVESVLEARGHAVVGRYDSSGAPAPLTGEVADIAFEFTTPRAAPVVLEWLAERGVATVSGTTGWSEVARIEALFDARGVPFVHAPNFCIGVQLMFRVAELLGSAARGLSGFDAGIVERHHTRKVDAPSGTALELARRFEDHAGRPAPVVALRQGGQPGEHRLVLEGPDESLEICHRARTRRVFAEGAVATGEWLVATGLRGSVAFDRFLSALFEEAQT